MNEFVLQEMSYLCAFAAGAMRNGGGGPNSHAGMKSERNQLLELIGLLKKQALLPVALFCFSKKRCDSCADAVSSLDLTTAAEKHNIHIFVERCLSRLKEGDRNLPQVRGTLFTFCMT